MAACCLALCGCSGTAPWTNEGGGTAFGAITGGLLGSTFGRNPGERAAGAAAGAVTGGILGNMIGRDMDERAKARAEASQIQALNGGAAGRPLHWDMDDGKTSGDITPGPEFNSGRGACRDYTHQIYDGGRTKVFRGVACRNPDGSWSAV